MSKPTATARYGAWRLLLVAVALVWLAPVFWRHVELRANAELESYENSGLFHFVYPAYHHAYGRLQAGDLPMWTSRQLCGAPVLGDPRISVFQPLNAPFLFLPTEKAMAAQAFLCLFMMGFGTVLFARALGLGYPGSLVAAVVWAFSGAAASAMSRPEASVALAWAPFVFWAVSCYMNTPTAGRALLLGALAGSLLLAPSLPLLAALGLPAAAFLLWQAAMRVRRGRRANLPGPAVHATPLIAALLLALAMGALHWVPAAATVRSLADAPALLFTLKIDVHAPADALGLAVQSMLCRPGLLPRPGYAGIATLLLVPAGLLAARRRHEPLFFGLVFLLCMGIYLAVESSPATPRVALLYPAVFALALVAGFGADALYSMSPRETATRPWAAAGVTLAVSTVLFYAASAQIRAYVLVLALLTVLSLGFHRRWASAVFGCALAAFLFFDLTAASRNAYRHPFPEAPAVYAQHREAVAIASDRAGTGRLALSARPLNVAMTANLGLATGHDVAGGALLPRYPWQVELWSRLTGASGSGDDSAPGEGPLLETSSKALTAAAPPALFNLLAARTILATPDGALYDGAWPAGSPSLHLLDTQSNVRVYVNEAALPRAYWVPNYTRAASANAAFDALGDAAFDPGMQAVIEAPVELPLVAAPGSYTRRDAHCTVESGDAEQVTVQVNAPGPGLLVLLDTYAPGWTARVNGAPSTVYRANGAFRAVAVPGGDSEVRFSYAAPGFLPALGLAMLLTLAALVAAAATRDRR